MVLKTPLGFANWSILIGFLLSWGVWETLDATLFKWGILTTHDGFWITCIFTVVSWLRMYFLNKYQHYLINKD